MSIIENRRETSKWARFSEMFQAKPDDTPGHLSAEGKEFERRGGDLNPSTCVQENVITSVYGDCQISGESS